MPVYYNQYGEQIDIYGRLIQPASPARPKQRPRPMYTEEAERSEWDLSALGGTQPHSQPQPQSMPIATDKPPCKEFMLIDTTTNINEIGNKEARLGETLLFYNEQTGEVYKKYVDFLSGRMILEVAQFTKFGGDGVTTETVSTDPRIDELYGQVELLRGEIESLKQQPKPCTSDIPKKQNSKGGAKDDKDNS